MANEEREALRKFSFSNYASVDKAILKRKNYHNKNL